MLDHRISPLAEWVGCEKHGSLSTLLCGFYRPELKIKICNSCYQPTRAQNFLSLKRVPFPFGFGSPLIKITETTSKQGFLVSPKSASCSVLKPQRYKLSGISAIFNVVSAPLDSLLLKNRNQAIFFLIILNASLQCLVHTGHSGNT